MYVPTLPRAQLRCRRTLPLVALSAARRVIRVIKYIPYSAARPAALPPHAAAVRAVRCAQGTGHSSILLVCSPDRLHCAPRRHARKVRALAAILRATESHLTQCAHTLETLQNHLGCLRAHTNKQRQSQAACSKPRWRSDESILLVDSEARGGPARLRRARAAAGTRGSARSETAPRPARR